MRPRPLLGNMTDFFQFDRTVANKLLMRVRTAAKLALVMSMNLALAVSAAQGQDSENVVRVETELAVFEVAVSDKKGKPVRNLDVRDLQILEDGVERPIEFFEPIRSTGVRRPLVIVFALDVSGSMTSDEMERLKAAMQSFIARLADYNSYFAVVSFAMDVRTLQSFTNRPDKLRAAFEKLDRESDGLSTHAYDAVDMSIRLLRKNAPKVIRESYPKRAVILITDGFPVGDVVRPETVVERANLAEASVYAVILPSYSNVLGKNKPVLTPLEVSGLVERTGGKSFFATEKNFEQLFTDLSEEITGSYAVAFYPGPKGDEKPRNVRISSKRGHIVRQNRGTLIVR